MALYSCASSGGVKQQQGARIGTVVGAGIVEIHIPPCRSRQAGKDFFDLTRKRYYKLVA
jgi:hypothetical protein